MSKKKGFLSNLFGGKKSGDCCNMEIVEENDTEVKTEQTSDCACKCNCSVNESEKMANDCCPEVTDGICCIKVLGSGCKSCHELYENAKTAVKNMGIDIEVEYITDLQQVVSYGVMSMPALVVNEKVVSAGKVNKSAEIEKLLHKLGF